MLGSFDLFGAFEGMHCEQALAIELRQQVLLCDEDCGVQAIPAIQETGRFVHTKKRMSRHKTLVLFENLAVIGPSPIIVPDCFPGT